MEESMKSTAQEKDEARYKIVELYIKFTLLYSGSDTLPTIDGHKKTDAKGEVASQKPSS